MSNPIRKGTMFLTLSLCLVLSACFKDQVSRTYTIHRPIYASKAAVLANIKAQPSKPITQTGKIYWRNNWIFMSDPAKGIHIINNANPAAPEPRAFIELPGNIDIAVNGSVLYADLFTDLLVIDIEDPLQPKLMNRIEDVFPERRYVNGFFVDSSQVIVDWIVKDTTVEHEMVMPGIGCPNCSFAELNSGAGSGGGKVNFSQGGSMARFALVNSFLYVVNMNKLGSYDVSNPVDPQLKGELPLGWGIETVYPFKDKLFIGSETGMFITDIQQPAAPSLLGAFTHARACDPVVADDDFAYVTLRTGNFCTGTLNQLDILDISNVLHPRLIKSFSMSNPHGLAVSGSDLYICDGDAGVKVYNAANKNAIQHKQTVKMAGAYDIILRNDLALVVGKKGLYQFAISADGKLDQLSFYAIRN